MTRVSIFSSLIDTINAFRVNSENNEIRTIVADRESVLRKYGDKRLLVETMAEKEFEKYNESTGGIRARIKSSSGGATEGKRKEPTTEEKNDNKDNGIDRGE